MKRVFVSVAVATVCSIAVVSGGQRLPTEGDPRAKETSSDATYGYSENNPIMVGEQNTGPQSERTFFDSLRGPGGERLTYKRAGSCCSFKTPNALIGGTILLDRFEVTYEGLAQPVVLYVDMYDYKQPMAPVGFTVAKR